MNKNILCAAVISTLGVPATQADIVPYGRINNAIVIQDSGDDSNVDVSSVSSRFGFMGSGEVGNGLTAIGRYEFATVTDRELDNVADLRLGYVGLSGGFGTVTIGQQWSAYFNTFGTLVSPTYTVGAFLYSSIAGGVFRGSNTVKYANSFGPVSLELDVRLNESGEGGDVAEEIAGDGIGLGLTFNATDNLSFSGAFDSEENNATLDEETGTSTPVEDTDRMGIAGQLTLGRFGVTAGFQNVEQGTSDIDSIYVWLRSSLGTKTSILVGFSQADTGTSEPEQVSLGLYHQIGGGLRVYAEHLTLDRDNDTDDFSSTILGMRIDF